MAAGRKVLIIGDSISIGYTPFVAEELAGRLDVAHHEGNSGDSRNTLARLGDWLAADADAALVHFNVGLHDLRKYRDARGYQVPLADYRQNLTEIVRRLMATGKALVWATTTPVIGERVAASAAEFVRRDEDVREYNAAAAEIMSTAGVPTDDLHAVVADAGAAELISPDGTHMTERGYRLLAGAVAEAIAKHCPA